MWDPSAPQPGGGGLLINCLFYPGCSLHVWPAYDRVHMSAVLRRWGWMGMDGQLRVHLWVHFGYHLSPPLLLFLPLPLGPLTTDLGRSAACVLRPTACMWWCRRLLVSYCPYVPVRSTCYDKGRGQDSKDQRWMDMAQDSRPVGFVCPELHSFSGWRCQFPSHPRPLSCQAYLSTYTVT